MIIYGHNHFRQRSFIPTELGLPQSFNEYNIEIRQRYFHLFWIPFFPIGKIWGLRKHADNKLYEMPDSVKQHVRQNTKVPGVSIWAFSGLMVIGLIGIIAIVSNSIQQAHYRALAEQEIRDEYNAKMQIIRQPELGDRYNFTDQNSYSTSQFMIDSIASGKIFLVKMDEGNMRTPVSLQLDTAEIKNYVASEFNFKGALLPGINEGLFELEEVARGEYYAKLPTFDPNEKKSGESGQAAHDRDAKTRR